MINVQKVQRIVIASALASGLLTAGIAASAQTTGTPATTNAAGATSNATNVSMSTTDAGATRRVQLEQANEDARRIAFRHLGTSL